MGDKGGRKDKGKKEQQKQALLSPKDKRKAKKAKYHEARSSSGAAKPQGQA